jgi:hypothetical protein
MALAADTMLKTEPNSVLVLNDGKKNATVPALKSGTAAQLFADHASKGIRIAGKVTQSATQDESSGVSNIATAATRASNMDAPPPLTTGDDEARQARMKDVEWQK